MWSLFRRPERSKRLRDLEEDLEKFRGQMKALRLEWEDTYDRLKHMMGRIAKRSALQSKETDSPEPEPENGEQAQLPGLGSLWTPQQLKLQNLILARRARGIPNA